jgi:hypothetical protein
MKTFRAALVTIFACCALAGPGFGTDVLTYHNDNARTGLNSQEATLTPINVNARSFGLIRNLPVDGAVFAQPLYVSNAQVVSGGQSQGFHNLLIVATEHDSVYAFDADSGARYWQVSMLGSGEVPSDGLGCSDLPTENGITSTPVIDRATGAHGAIYLLAMSKTSDSVQYVERLHALDLATGQDLRAPVTIQATYPGNGPGSDGQGNVIFYPAKQRGRAGLLLTNGTIYTCWGSFCDFPSFNGWIIAYNEQTLAQTLVFNTNPNGTPPSSDLPDGSGSGIWQAGQPPAVDAAGDLYLATGNGPFDTNLNSNGFPVSGDYGDTLLKLTPSLQVTNYFTPTDQLSLALNDGDFGSGGTLVLDITDSANAVHHLAIAAGKDSNIYIVNRDNMGRFNSQANSIYQVVTGVLQGGVWSSPAYFNGSIYYDSQGHSLLQFKFTSNATLDPVPVSASTATFPFPGGTPSISSLGSTNGIVWIKELLDGQVILLAYDATNLANQLYSSAGVNFGAPTKFGPPTVCNGKVFVGTANSVGVFGLLQPMASPRNVVTIPNFPDFDGDGKQDLLWRNTSTGQVGIWLMNGSGAKAAAVLSAPPFAWVIINTGDFNGDGKSDILWQLAGTSQYGVWFMNGTQVAGIQNFTLPTSAGNPSNAGQICCVADFDGDGLADLVTFDRPGGMIYFWKNTGSMQFVLQTSYRVAPGTGWVPLGAVPLNGPSASPAVIWRNTSTGEVAVWFMNAFTWNGVASFGNPGNNVVLKGFGDFSGDGNADLLLFNTSTNVVGYWQSNGAEVPGAISLAQVAGTWIPVGAENLNGAGNADIIWRQSSTGALGAWQVSGYGWSVPIGSLFVGSVWQLQPQGLTP